jgi:hypothetical protein
LPCWAAQRRLLMRLPLRWKPERAKSICSHAATISLRCR